MVPLSGGPLQHYLCSTADKSCFPPGTKGLGEPTEVDLIVQPFKLSRTPVTLEQFKRCVDAGACKYQHRPREVPLQPGGCNWSTKRLDHPMNCVTWKQAREFCAWMGARLPSASEWEWAAKGGEDRVFPWCTEEKVKRRACWLGFGSDAPNGTCSVGARILGGKSKQGIRGHGGKRLGMDLE